MIVVKYKDETMNNTATDLCWLHKYCSKVYRTETWQYNVVQTANYALRRKLVAKALPKSIFFADE